ncbi:hypothetical protein AVEN_169168-1 [Araneus ventricosus]|uniref:Uncharacterized protein n=1 Tax=Araneus ventricosus TaxID=182803 RepID=A0A4Y2KBB2_ARAVE|nr:hypothetical protein AVEN_169168-1 [Araneus ventricosus]
MKKCGSRGTLSNLVTCPSVPKHSFVKPKCPAFRKKETHHNNFKPAGVFFPKLSRILPQKGAVSPSPARLKKFEPTVTQNPISIRRFFIIVIEKYLGKESNSKSCVPIFHSYRFKDKLTQFAP